MVLFVIDASTICAIYIHLYIFAIYGCEYMVGGNPRYAAAVVETEENRAVPPSPQKYDWHYHVA
jgi:hypothetical protein